MRCTVLLVALISLPAAAASAQLQYGDQPQYGDLVFTTADGQSWNRGYTAYLNPAHPNTMQILATTPAGNFHNWVRMAPNNTDMVITRADWNTNPASGDLVNLEPNGTQTTIATFPFPTYHTDGYELDHDNKWILSARAGHLPSTIRPNFVLGVDHISGAVTTFSTLNTTTWFNEIAIDRDPGSMPYVVVSCCLQGTSGPEVVKTDRQGTVVTLVSGSSIPSNRAVELHPRTGDYILGDSVNVFRMDKTTGKKTRLTSFFANAIKIKQDDTAWIADGRGSHTFCRYDLSQNKVVATIPSPVTAGWYLTGVEVYGSRTLVCKQTSPATVTVNVQSRLQGAGGKQYALATSFARRPAPPAKCLRFPNGEYLFLDATNPLFYASALGLLPAVFSKFQGTLNSKGNASATVNIPSRAQGLGIAVFVAGVIFDQTGVVQVTNTHWFVL